MTSANTFHSISRRSMHVISSASSKSTKTQQSPHKLARNGFAALVMQEQAPQLSSARDIELLLSNIGAGHRASRLTIESMMQGAGTLKTTNAQHCTNLTGHEIIELIAQIRSI